MNDAGQPGTATHRAERAFALAFGLFLGLAILKFGNPVVLDHAIAAPADLRGWLHDAWPTRWAVPLLLPLAAVGVLFGRPAARLRAAGVPWPLLALPVAWLAWQHVAGARTVDAALTDATLRQLAGCVACFAVGFLVIGRQVGGGWFWVGLLAGFLLCLHRAAQQHFFELRRDHDALVAGEAGGWTNFAPQLLSELRASGLVLRTNGVDVANPAILDKMRRARVNGTMVYPNALAGLILLLLPAAVCMLAAATARLRGSVRFLVVGLVAFLGLGGLYWTGSKAGWLVALAVAATWMLAGPWNARLKAGLVAALLIGGLGLFGLRFAGYFAGGATSAAARADYWRAAVANTLDNPVFGSGPGTFQRPYARLKPPAAEMARLAHNDYLEQATDSGIPGFVLYGAWIALLLAALWRREMRDMAGGPEALLRRAVFFGLAGWFLHGFAEFGLYIPAAAWTAFTIAGALLAGDMPNRRP